MGARITGSADRSNTIARHRDLGAERKQLSIGGEASLDVVLLVTT
jgi:hypothetical protein